MVTVHSEKTFVRLELVEVQPRTAIHEKGRDERTSENEMKGYAVRKDVCVYETTKYNTFSCKWT